MIIKQCFFNNFVYICSIACETSSISGDANNNQAQKKPRLEDITSTEKGMAI